MNDNASAAPSTGRRFALAVLSAWVVSAVVCTVISLAAQALGIDAAQVKGLQPPLYLAFALVGLVVAAVAWTLVRSRAARPSAVLRVLVPVVVVLSMVPNILIGLAGLGWPGAIALMLMHLVVAAAGVVAFVRFLPLPAERPAAREGSSAR